MKTRPREAFVTLSEPLEWWPIIPLLAYFDREDLDKARYHYVSDAGRWWAVVEFCDGTTVNGYRPWSERELNSVTSTARYARIRGGAVKP